MSAPKEKKISDFERFMSEQESWSSADGIMLG